MTTRDSYVDMWHIMEALQTRYLLTQEMIDQILRNNDSCYERLDLPPPKKVLSERVKEYLDKGADPNGMPGASMLRPIHAAAKIGNAEVLTLLVDAGAEVNTVDAHNSRSPLHYAAEICADCVKILLKHGAYPDVRDGDDHTPLHWAAYKNRFECAKYLLESKATVNALSINTDQPLHFAAMRGSYECIELLLDYGADVTVKNCAGKTPLIKSAITRYGGVLDDYEDDPSFNVLMRASGRIVVRTPPPYPNTSRYLEHEDIIGFILSITTHVAPLASLCRAVIRQQLVNKYLPDAVRSLHLPKQIERYLLLQTKT
ncbi:uncharacterized protein LOC120348408 [Styela clava]|uniref:ankyrin repeat and SOCS box protein 8-like n=1 Tax=Styela clava TaxID=7725 RepID=UPI00193928AF|nr:ankyrin repeat and SOCS box protein 8-like [Styela clava]